MNDKTAFLFPGQGAQAIGMGASLVDASEVARSMYERGSSELDLDLVQLIAEGPEDLLNTTRISQPAIFLTSMAVLDALSRRLESDAPVGTGIPAGATAGLSLGEYSALVFAGCLSFEHALDVVVKRGRYMQEACDERPGTMASLVGLPVERVEEIVEQASPAGIVAIANYNSPEQTVVSGEREAVAEALRLAQEAGCKRAIELRVAGAYHSPLMAGATEKLAAALRDVPIEAPRCPFYSNVTGERVADPEAIREGLVQQVESPVRWVSIHRAIVRDGATRGIEAGPGKVITGLSRKIDRSLRVTPVCEVDSLEALLGGGDED